MSALLTTRLVRDQPMPGRRHLAVILKGDAF